MKTPEKISLLLRIFAVLLLTSAVNAQDHGGDQEEDIEYPPYDGWYNNFAHPDWGAAETPLLRLLPPAYSDGVYKPSGANRPNPIAISQIVFNGSTGFPSHRNRTALLVFFGQQVVEEILDAQRAGCPIEYFNIKIPKGHPEFDPNGEGGREMPLHRSRFDQRTGQSPNVPREQLNEISAYFDGTLMYGPNKAWTDALRLFKGGRLKATNDTNETTEYFPAYNKIRLPFANPPPPRDHYLKPVGRFFTIGNPRGNENPFLLTFGILWFRWHNVKARQIEAAHPDWSDEKIFNEARKWTIATHQKVVYFDWIPAWLNQSVGEYTGYNQNVHPGIAHVFQSAAMRFGHTLVPPGVLRRNKECVFRKTSEKTKFANQTGLRTCNTYWNPQEAIRETDIDELLMGMASQITEREDNIITPDLRGNVFGSLDFSRRDLMAINIQRGRDHGLPDYNTAREFFGLPRRTNFSEINPNLFNEDPELFRKLEELYGEDGINNLDIWPAGIMETTEKGPGELFRAIILNQFRRIRDADRFWFENYKKNKLFTEAEVAELRNITLKDIIVATTNIGPDDIQDNPFFWHSGDPCPQPMQLSHLPGGGVEDCTPLKSIDYFEGSAASYIGTIILIFGTIIPAVIILVVIARWPDRNNRSKNNSNTNSQEVSVTEWMGAKAGKRPVTILMDCAKKHILVKEESRLLRIIDVALLEHNGTVAVSLSGDLDMKMMSIRVPKEYDLVLHFRNSSERQEFLTKLKTFLKGCGEIRLADPITVSEKMMKSTAITRAARQAKLEAFFDAVFSHALHYSSNVRRQSLISSESDANDIVNCELTRFEFAEALGLKPESMFVENMFKMVDTNENGYISFREFLDFFVIFSKGTADEKAKLMFDMYDINRTGQLSKEDFKMMIKSMIELANENVEDDKIDQLGRELFRGSNLESKPYITFQDFKHFLKEYEADLDYASLSFQFGDVKQPAASPARRENAPSRARRTIIKAYSQTGDRNGLRNNNHRFSLQGVSTIQRAEPTTGFGRMMNSFVKYFENYRRQIFWATLYTLVVAGIFIERAYYYSLEREQTGLRRHLGYGVSITRGAASAMMFTYSSLLVTMCRSIISLLRETFLNQFIPFDSANSMHKFIAYQAMIYTLAHVIGHCFNFYHISTQAPGDLGCMFRNFHHPTNYLPKFTDWAWDTITGCTGILMCLQLIFIYVFSTEYARRKAFRAFWFVHASYPAFFILMIMHGAGRFIQAPFFYYFFLGPVILYTIDRLISVSSRKIEISVVRSELLPSDVTYLELRKPPNFEYRSGQWVRLACLAHSSIEFHPLTLTSAPHENHLSVHIRAVGPWTRNIRKLYDPRHLVQKALPKVFIDGPYGLGHQDWSKYEVSVLIGGGIGVTPFASILKDIAYRSQKGQMGTICKKVYFIWVTRTQRHFEWMTDIIREVESKDHSNIVVVNTFITQFREKFDFRTTMLYICERHFQKISDRSLFTGLRSITHFGRPDFSEIFKVIMREHPNTNVFGVFSCGPPPMTRSVEQACARDNAYTSDVLFVHRYENF